MNSSSVVSIATWSKDYSGSHQATEKEIVDGPPPPLVIGPLEIESPNTESVVRLPSKGVLRKPSYNSNARTTHHYNIVEDLAQALSVMSTLEVLQSCPSRRKALLSAIGGIDPTNTSLLAFNLENFIP